MESSQAQKTTKNIYPEKIYYTLILRNFLHFLRTKLFLCFKKWNFSLFQESNTYFSKWNFLATRLSNFLCFRKEFENHENQTKTPCSTLREKFPNTEFFLTRIFRYPTWKFSSTWVLENPDQKTHLDTLVTFHAVQRNPLWCFFKS